MKCQICGKYFIKEITFSSLFVVQEMCFDCQLQFAPRLNHECIPFSGGLIDYYSIYDCHNDDYRQDTWLFRNMDKCFNLAISGQSDYDIIICVGSNEYEIADGWLPLLLGYQRVLMISLFYYSFDKFEMYF
ncbi:MAG: hypothetical protein WC088_00575 [Candidatus Izemoplasmatales bacterium]|jgi:hypothetical protein|nr:hypothetical protein [Candidatus Izemoplasmatales bacterium]MDD4595497.1 hypothetical protein [Candidatus Izemoplasmatales bacterium]